MPRPTPAGKACPAPVVYQRRRPERTLLYRLVQTHLAAWLALRDDGQSRSAPALTEREFRRYLECGILAHGFARARGADCGHDFIVAYSCKGRGICPSCTTRRMAETAAHLVDHVFLRLPVRQWVLSFPKRLRYRLDDAELQTAVLHRFLRCIEQGLRRGLVAADGQARIGAVVFIHLVFIHRIGALLNAPLHVHVVAIGGVFHGEDAETLRFEQARLTPDAVQGLQATIRQRIVGLFVRCGLLERADGEAMRRCEHGGGFSLDTSVRVEANDRQGLERLLRYCARPAFAQERLRQIDAEHLVYESPKPGPGGRVSQILTAVTALAVVPKPPPAAADTVTEKSALRRAARYVWAMLLARIYAVFPLTCPQCGGTMRIIAFIDDPSEVKKILTHLGEPTAPPKPAPARGPPLWEAAGPGGDDDPLQPIPAFEFDQRIACSCRLRGTPTGALVPQAGKEAESCGAAGEKWPKSRIDEQQVERKYSWNGG